MSKMGAVKVSAVTADELVHFLRLGPCGDSERELLMKLLEAAVSYLVQSTGLDKDAIDEHSEFVYAAMVLVSHMYDNRSFHVGADYSNHMVQHIINMHRVNYA